jgi:hypothetical protein
MIKILKPNENPYRNGSKVALAWQIVRGFGGRDEESCTSALDAAGLSRHGEDQVGNRGYLRQFDREGLITLPGYKYRPR